MKTKTKRGGKAPAEADTSDLESAIDEALALTEGGGEEDSGEQEALETETEEVEQADELETEGGETGEDGSLVGRMAKLTDSETDEEVLGEIIGQDSNELTIRVETGPGEVQEYIATLDDIELVEAAEPKAEEPAKGKPKKAEAPKAKSSKPGKTEAPKKAKAQDQTVQAGREVRRIPIDSIAIPKAKPREFYESAKYALMLREAKARKKAKLWPQRMPIEVDSWEKPTLVEGLRRIMMMKAVGETHIDAMLDEGIGDSYDRVYAGLRANVNRDDMHWHDLAQCFAYLVKSEKYTQATLAKDFGLDEGTVSRMIAALKLPKEVLEHAKDAGEDKEVKYSPAVFLGLAGAPPAALKEAAATMKTGGVLTLSDVRSLRKEAGKTKPPQKGGEKPTGRKPGRTGATGSKGLRHVDLSGKETGPNIRVRVQPTEVTFTISIGWENKTFRGFDPLKAIKAAFDEAFKSEATSLDSFDGLVKAMTAAKGELPT